MTEQNTKRKQLPAFANETEEANWWYDNREQHAADFIKAADEGRVRINTMAERLARLRGETILKLEAHDKAKADALARQRGITIESYLQILVHEALDREPAPAS